jgi:hypothetical protein
MNIGTSHTVTKIKIKRNQNLISLLEIENKIIKLIMIIKYRLLTNNTKRIEMINEINDIERQQLYTYDIQRHNIVTELTNNVNNTNVFLDDIKEDILKLKPDALKAIDQIHTLNKAIPNIIVTNNKEITPEDLQEFQKKSY